jgi:hypothetical protein
MDDAQIRSHAILTTIAKGYAWGVKEISPWEQGFWSGEPPRADR